MDAAARASMVPFLSATVANVILPLLSIYLLENNPTAPWRGVAAARYR